MGGNDYVYEWGILGIRPPTEIEIMSLPLPLIWLVPLFRQLGSYEERRRLRSDLVWEHYVLSEDPKKIAKGLAAILRWHLTLDSTDADLQDRSLTRKLVGLDTLGDPEAANLRCELIDKAPIQRLARACVSQMMEDGHDQALITRPNVGQFEVRGGAGRVFAMSVPASVHASLIAEFEFATTCDPAHYFSARCTLPVTHFAITESAEGHIIRWS